MKLLFVILKFYSCPKSDELNNNKVPVSSPNLPAPVRKRGTPTDSESVKAMKAQIRDEQRKKQQLRLQNFYAILCNPWISSAMAMAMSIYRTLCVLVFLKISLLEMLIAFGNEHLIQIFTKSRILDLQKTEIRFQTSLQEMSLVNRFKNFYQEQLFKNFYQEQLFNFCLRRRFFPENFTPRDAHCFWQ